MFCRRGDCRLYTILCGTYILARPSRSDTRRPNLTRIGSTTSTRAASIRRPRRTDACPCPAARPMRSGRRRQRQPLLSVSEPCQIGDGRAERANFEAPAVPPRSALTAVPFAPFRAATGIGANSRVARCVFGMCRSGAAGTRQVEHVCMTRLHHRVFSFASLTHGETLFHSAPSGGILIYNLIHKTHF